MKKEDSGDSDSTKDKLMAPNIFENNSLIKSPCKSWIGGDFTENPFEFNGEEIIDVSKKNKTNDPSEVYMKSFLDLFQAMSCRIESLMNVKTKSDVLLEQLHEQLLVGNYNAAFRILEENNSSVKLNQNFVFKHFLNSIWSDFVFDLRKSYLMIKEKSLNIKELFDKSVDKALKKTEECERLKNIINQQRIEHSAQVDTLLTEKNNLKDNIIKIISKFGTSESLNSKLEEDLIVELEQIFQVQTESIKALKHRKEENEKLIDELKSQNERQDIQNLNKQIEDQKVLIKQLKQENLNFSEAVQKLSEKNIRFKQELMKHNYELKKMAESIQMKNETIQRQKALIEMFQERLTSSIEFPISELRRKKQELEARIEIETDYVKRQALKKEKNDYEKRLSDFIDLNSRHK